MSIYDDYRKWLLEQRKKERFPLFSTITEAWHFASEHELPVRIYKIEDTISEYTYMCIPEYCIPEQFQEILPVLPKHRETDEDLEDSEDSENSEELEDS